MKLLNLGCGPRFHPEWINLDFVARPPHVRSHNLLKGIPFPDASMDVVYHSHVLEHFEPADGRKFVQECFRVLKPGGLHRVVVPDLENIVREYLKQLRAAESGEPGAADRYDWIKLELIDQLTRHRSGGGCGAYLFQGVMPAEGYVYERWGEEARQIRASSLDARAGRIPRASFRVRAWRKLQRLLGGSAESAAAIGRFRLSGEVHLWMYDRYSLGRLLVECGFIAITVRNAFDSGLASWARYGLEANGTAVLKPDSLVIEANKP